MDSSHSFSLPLQWSSKYCFNCLIFSCLCFTSVAICTIKNSYVELDRLAIVACAFSINDLAFSSVIPFILASFMGFCLTNFSGEGYCINNSSTQPGIPCLQKRCSSGKLLYKICLSSLINCVFCLVTSSK